MRPHQIRSLIASARHRPRAFAASPAELGLYIFGVMVGAGADFRRLSDAWRDPGDARWPAIMDFGAACDRAQRACDALWPDDEAPPCLCGASEWEGAGVNFSAILCQSWHRCRACRRVGQRVDTATYRTFLLPTEVNGAGAELTAAHHDWIRSAVEPLWNRRRTEIEGARREIGDAVVRVINRALDLPLGRKGYDIEDAALRERWGALYDSWADSAMYRRPPGSERAPVPPDVPAGLAVFLLQPGGWERAGGGPA